MRGAALRALADTRFDVVVVGGGVVGAFAAWDAALRGLTVALVERDDFGSGTSSNCLKIAHGGLRYLQRADLPRVRASVHERAVLLRAAPHLVRPLACIMPTSPSGARHASALALALRVNELVSRHPFTHGSGERRPPAGRVLSRAEYEGLAGPLATPAAPGGALWGDALIESPERVLLGVVRAAREAGAVMVNHAEATALLAQGGQVRGVRVRAPEGEMEVRAHGVLNAAGPWATRALSPLDPAPHFPLVLGYNVVVARSGITAAVAVPHPLGHRMLFAVPWRSHLTLGTGYIAAPDGLPAASPGAEAITALLDAFNTELPALQLRPEEVTFVHAGRLPGTPGRHRTAADALRDRPVLVDHAESGGPVGLVTVAAEKWTTARRTAERAVSLVQRRLGQRPRAGGTDRRWIAGGEIADVAAFVGGTDGVPDGAGEADGAVDGVDAGGPGGARPVRSGGTPSVRSATRHIPLELPPDGPPPALAAATVRRLRALYGTIWREVAALAAAEPALARPLGGTDAVAAEVVYGVRSEMALHLTDIVLRRTELGTAGYPGDDLVREVADVAAAELGWSAEQRAGEIRAVRERYPPTVAEVT